MLAEAHTHTEKLSKLEHGAELLRRVDPRFGDERDAEANVQVGEPALWLCGLKRQHGRCAHIPQVGHDRVRLCAVPFIDAPEERKVKLGMPWQRPAIHFGPRNSQPYDVDRFAASAFDRHCDARERAGGYERTAPDRGSEHSAAETGAV